MIVHSEIEIQSNSKIEGHNETTKLMTSEHDLEMPNL